MRGDLGPRRDCFRLEPLQPIDDTTPKYEFLHQSPDLTVLQVILSGCFRSPPHNHLVWAVIGMYEGSEKNIFYRKEEEHLLEDSVKYVSAPEVIMLAPDTIHGISNPSPQRSYALHVYGGAFSNPARSLWNPFTLLKEPFQPSALLKYEQEMNRSISGDAA